MQNIEWLRKLYKRASSGVPIMTGSKVEFSRRMEGQYTYDGEIYAYPEVVLYMQKGLGNHLPVMQKMMQKINQLQNECDPYTLSCFVFGLEKDKLSHAGRIFKISSRINANKAVQKMCELAGTDLSDRKDLLPALYPPTNIYSPKSGAGKEDLLIFICRDRDSVDICDKVSEKLKYRSYKRTFWIYLNDGENIECENHRERIRREQGNETSN